MGFVEALLDLASQMLSALEKLLATPKTHLCDPATLVVSCVLFALVAIPGAASMFGDFAKELELEELDEMFDSIDADRPTIDP